MRVKIGNQWFKPEPGKPIAVELTQEEWLKIKSLNADNDFLQYLIFQDPNAGPAADDMAQAWLAAR